MQVFYIFGIAGIAWSAWWERLIKSAADQDPKLIKVLEADKQKKEEEKAAQQGRKNDDTPWRAFLRSKPVRALTYVHFCNNWSVLHPADPRCPASHFSSLLQLSSAVSAE